MTSTSSASTPTTMPNSSWETSALLSRRGELCAAAQFAALEGIAGVSDSDEARAELAAIDAALRARGVDPHAAR